MTGAAKVIDSSRWAFIGTDGVTGGDVLQPDAGADIAGEIS